MRVVVGTPKTKTPMMAVLMRDAQGQSLLERAAGAGPSLTAKRISEQGLSYLKDFHYEVLSDWDEQRPCDRPQDGQLEGDRLGQGQARRSGFASFRGRGIRWANMKFEMPNDYGIYLHDTPHQELFAESERMAQQRLRAPGGLSPLRFVGVRAVCRRRPRQFEQRFELPRPVPVYMTYLTVAPSGNGVIFRPDPYGFDALAMPQMFGPASKMASAILMDRASHGSHGSDWRDPIRAEINAALLPVSGDGRNNRARRRR